MSAARNVKLFKNGRSQAVRIPREFELPGTEAVIRRDGTRLILEAMPQKPRTLAELLATLAPIDEDFPEMDDPVPQAVNL